MGEINSLGQSFEESFPMLFKIGQQKILSPQDKDGVTVAVRRKAMQAKLHLQTTPAQLKF
jgi:hypothetical protein